MRWVANEVIIEFNPDVVDTTFVNDPEKTAILLADLVPDSVLNYMNAKTGIDFYKVTALKIFLSMHTNDTISISRSGDTIPIPKFWSMFNLLLPDSNNVPLVCDSLMRGPQQVIYGCWPNEIARLLDGANDYYYNHPTDPNDDPNGKIYGQYSLHDLDGSYPDAHINIEPAWDIENGSDYIKVGVFDHGINWTHIDFRFSEPFDYTNVVIKGGKAYTIAGQPSFENVQNVALDPHGTAIAGVIGAVRNNESAYPLIPNIAGIAGGSYANGKRGVSLYMMATRGQYENITNYHYGVVPELTAMYEAATSNIYGLHIGNHSYAGATPPFIRVLHFAWRNGMVNVASRGQIPVVSSLTGLVYPACYDDDYIINVGGSGTDGTRFHNGNGGNGTESCYDHNLDLIAPGSADLIFSTTNFDACNYFSGTSASGPHVAGVAALLMSQQNPSCLNSPPNLSPEDVEFLLQKYAKDVTEDITGGSGLIGYDIYSGWGLLDAGNALQHMDYPQYQVYHSQDVLPSITGSLLNQTISLNYAIPGNFSNIPAFIYDLPPGAYTADRYEYSFSFHDVFPNTTQILDYWPVPSRTYGVDGSTSVGLFDGYANYNFTPDLNGHELTVNATTFAWHITNGPNGPLDMWIPTEAPRLRAGYSVHIYDNTITSNESMEQPAVLVFPSPMDEMVNVQVDCPASSSLSIQLLDIQGRIVQDLGATYYPAGIFTIPINVSSLRSGLYICKIQINNNSYVEKLVKN